MAQAFGVAVKRAGCAVVGSIFLAVSLSPSAVLAQYHDCEPGIQQTGGGFTSNAQHNGTTGSVYGVKAVINTTLSTFRPCTLVPASPETEGAHGTSAWVAIWPSPGNPEDENGEAVLQIGITHCNVWGEPTCDVGYPAKFWAFGGCDEYSPTGRWLGDTDDNAHTYTIRHISSGGSRYSLDFDGVYQSVTKYAADPGLECWLPHRHGALYSTETWEAGDGIADASAKVIFSSVGWRLTDSGAWQSPTWTGTSNCLSGAPASDDWGYTIYLDHNCDISNADPTQFYSWTTLN